MTPPRLELRRISKQYPGVKANDAVSLSVAAGEIHAVLGENGAGKSTLMKIIAGAVAADAGELLWDGQPRAIRSPSQARALGISMVYQHFSLFDALTAAQNIWLGLDKALSLDEVRERVARLSAEYGLPLDPERPVHALSVGERQRVEILRALMTAPRLLILDEPTSVLTPQAVEALFGTLRQLAAQGCAILYISHKLDEIRALCQRCTVLRAGRVTGEVDPRQETNASLSRLMIGAEPPALATRAARPLAPARLRVSGLRLAPETPHGTALDDVSLELRQGEILGLAGVSGNGQQELLRVLSGEDRRAPRGVITWIGDAGARSTSGRLAGDADRVGHAGDAGDAGEAGRGAGAPVDLGPLGPAKRRALGLHHVPEERLGRGAVPSMSLAQNTLLTRREPVGRFGHVSSAKAAALARHLIERFGVRAAGPQAAARSLSGGNLQKFIMGREIDAAPKALIVAQPTWGVDVGAAAQIRAELLALRDAGCALLVLSEELDELFALSDRLMVMARGRLSPAIPVAEATVQRIGLWMSGLWEDDHAAA
ncbi:ABC transporter ATP-binding protein [Mitsuaria sp. GD03876]|uniref:ABC transporter ATP-binding protein n=1 Tax=Mitsuaria sp. GD03876 TaxID=2975399 RepID=UPI00244AD391|nr:ABC transporter ATP-binding protein [Mitsuaria sp. GD03876]MDH0864544.1 ABC transporter ATP-binding protein [Mitsuaria sp. GD03876]